MNKVIYSIIILIIGFLVFLGYIFEWHVDSKYWSTSHPKQINPYDRFMTMRFVSENMGFIGGSCEGPLNLNALKSVLYKTENGGKNWTRKEFSKGEVEQIEFIENTLFVLIRIHTENSFRNLKSELWSSEDLGDTWMKVYETGFVQHIMKVLPINKNNLIGVFKIEEYDPYKSQNQIKHSKDGGKTWENIFSTPEISNYSEIELFSNALVYFAESSLKILEFKNFNAKVIFPIQNEYGYKLDKDGIGNLWVLQSNKKSIQLIKFDKDWHNSTIDLTNRVDTGFPASFNVENNNISLILSAGESILGVSKKFYHSNNGGGTWNREKIPFSLYTNPIAYFGNNSIWIYGGAGMFQQRKVH